MKLFTIATKIGTTILFFTIVSLALGQSTATAGVFKVGIMQAQAGAAKKYAPLETYLLNENIQVKFVPFNTYKEAAQLFAKGDVDGMFSGSGVAGAFILKGLAKPLVRAALTGPSSSVARVRSPLLGTPDIFAIKG